MILQKQNMIAVIKNKTTQITLAFDDLISAEEVINLLVYTNYYILLHDLITEV
jgi:hypothetical protein